MPYHPRIITSRLEQLARSFPIVVVSGARQVGKSTLIEHVFADRAQTVVLDPVVDVGAAREDPDLFLDNHPPPLILDEIQYAPELMPALKRRVDKTRAPFQYILTSSQQWQVLEHAAESLAGRAVFADLFGFSLAESAQQVGTWFPQWVASSQGVIEGEQKRVPPTFTLVEHLWRGFLPQARTLEAAVVSDFWSAYERRYIERDVGLLSDVLDLQQFRQFTRLASALTATEINFSELGRDIGISPETSKRWLSLLRSTYQWLEFPPYFGNTVKRISKRHKGYFADTGLICHSQAISTPTTISAHPMAGRLFETAVVTDIVKQSTVMSPAPRFYHWRTSGGAEVDLIAEYNGTLFPIEVKLKSNPTPRDTSGIKAFRKTYPSANIGPGLVVSPCEEMRRLNDTDYTMPWDAIA